MNADALAVLKVLAQGAASALVGVGGGWLFVRWQQRVKWQEELQGKLADLQSKALVEVLTSLAQLHYQFELDGKLTESIRNSIVRRALLLPTPLRRLIIKKAGGLNGPVLGMGERSNTLQAAEEFATEAEKYMPGFRRQKRRWPWSTS